MEYKIDRDSINEKLNEIICFLDNSSAVEEYKSLKNDLLSDEKLIKEIERINSLSIYSPEYKELKIELFSNSKYQRLQKLENEFQMIGLEISGLLNSLTDRKKCHDKNN